jgi:diguanylate cyclase (GGDEF)-like protein/PAS domain S-box-containing protein
MLEFQSPDIFRTVIESLQTGVYFVDRDHKILFWNDGAEKITGYLRHEVVGCFCRDNLQAPEHTGKTILPDAADSLASVMREGKPAIAEISLRHKAGHRIFVRLRAVPIRNSHGAIIGAAESFDENLAASDWDRRQTKLAGYGCLDQTSGVLNKNVTLSRLRESLATFAEVPVPFSILAVEVDRMEKIQSSYGLAVVGPVLHVVAQTIENSLRPTDFLGRIADNRFLAILSECGADEIEKVAERLKKMVTTSEVRWWGDTWPVSASFGGATIHMGDTLESMIDRAESSLAESIAAGGNRVTVAA